MPTKSGRLFGDPPVSSCSQRFQRTLQHSQQVRRVSVRPTRIVLTAALPQRWAVQSQRRVERMEAAELAEKVCALAVAVLQLLPPLTYRCRSCARRIVHGCTTQWAVPSLRKRSCCARPQRKVRPRHIAWPAPSHRVVLLRCPRAAAHVVRPLPGLTRARAERKALQLAQMPSRCAVRPALDGVTPWRPGCSVTRPFTSPAAMGGTLSRSAPSLPRSRQRGSRDGGGEEGLGPTEPAV